MDNMLFIVSVRKEYKVKQQLLFIHRNTGNAKQRVRIQIRTREGAEQGRNKWIHPSSLVRLGH